MPWPHDPQPPDGDEDDWLAGLLDAITDAIVELHLRYYHRVPRTAKTEMLDDDLLCCTLSGVYTDVEKTLIEIEKGDLVSATRGLFQRAMSRKYIDAVEDLTGRTVDAFISKLYVGPDMAVELFVLRPLAPSASPTPED